MTELRTAHESTDDTIPAHCPWDGSGQIIANPDGSIHCEYCQRNFTLKVQPQFPAMPQDPTQRNIGQPGNPEGTSDGTEPDDGDLGAGSDQEQDPGAVDDGTGQQAAVPQTTDQPQPPPEEDPRQRMSFRTSTGARLSEEDYLDHLAVTFAVDRDRVIQRIRQRRAGARRG